MCCLKVTNEFFLLNFFLKNSFKPKEYLRWLQIKNMRLGEIYYFLKSVCLTKTNILHLYVLLFNNFPFGNQKSLKKQEVRRKPFSFIVRRLKSFTKYLRQTLVLFNLLNHQKVSKYYEYDCLNNFLLLFMSLLSSFAVKSSHILTGIYFIFLKKNILDQT